MRFMRISREERLILIELFLFRESRGLLISTQFRPIFSSRLFSFEKGTIVKREKYNTQSNEPRFFQPCDLIQTIFEKFLNTKENYVYIYIYIYIIKKFRRKRITRFTNLLRIFQIVPARRAASSPLRPSPIINTP